MSPFLISTIIGLALSAIALKQIGPSIVESISAKTVESGLNREASLIQQIIRYKSVEGVFPATIADMVGKDYWSAQNNINGFGGSYTFIIDEPKNQISINTTIADADKRAQYISNYRHIFRPVDTGVGGVVTTTFIIPTKGSMSMMAGSSVGSIPISSLAPDPSSHAYWYDTSGSSPIFRVSNGTAWAQAAAATSSEGGVVAPSAATISASFDALPITATEGDVRYVYNSVTQSLDTMFYANGQWVQPGSGAYATTPYSPTTATFAATTLPIAYVNSSFSYDFKPLLSAIYTQTSLPVAIKARDVKWSTASFIPSGMTFDTSTGVLSGTPTVQTSKFGNWFQPDVTYNGQAVGQGYILKVSPELMLFKSISSGDRNSCGITMTNGVKCWGWNDYGQLGIGTLVGSAVSPVDVSGLSSGVASVSLGANHMCVLMIAGGVKCWGQGINGAIGNNSTLNATVPVDVTGLTSGIKSVVALTYHTCALTTAGAVKCWGDNYYKTLGNAGGNSSVPVDVTGLTTGVREIFGRGVNACAITIAGDAKCWGGNGNGQLGNNATTESWTYTDVTVLSGIASIKTGYGGHTCALTSAGGVKCWGYNGMGQLGNGTTTDSLTPVDVIGLTSGVASISLGSYHSCAVTIAGTAKCWGRNNYGQLGDGLQYVNSSPPVTPVGLDSGVLSIEAGDGHTCAVVTGNITKCWGWSNYYQLGIGTGYLQLTPYNVGVAW